MKTKLSLLNSQEGLTHGGPVTSGFAPHLKVKNSSALIPVRFGRVVVERSGNDNDRSTGELFTSETAEVEIEFLYPEDVDYSELSQGSRFTVMYGGKAIGGGVVV